MKRIWVVGSCMETCKVGECMLERFCAFVGEEVGWKFVVEVDETKEAVLEGGRRENFGVFSHTVVVEVS